MTTLTFRLSFTGKQFFHPNCKVHLSNGIIYNSHSTVVSQKYHSNRIQWVSESTRISKQIRPQLPLGQTHRLCTDAEGTLLSNKISVQLCLHSQYSSHSSAQRQEPATGPHRIKSLVFSPGTSDLRLCQVLLK